MEGQDVATVPVGDVDLEIPNRGRNDGGRLQTLLHEFDLPALIIENDFHAHDRVLVRLLCDGMQQPLSATTVNGILHWEPCELMPLAQALFDEYGNGVFLGDEWFGVEAPEPDETPRPEFGPERTTTGRLAWTTTEQRDMLPMAARLANQPLGVADVDHRRLVTPTLSRSDAQQSPAWMVSNELLMWRDGEARGIASFANYKLLVHVWGLEVRVIDPTGGWELDVEGSTVHDYLAHLAPVNSDARDWATRFKLDAAQSETLRVLLRQRGSTAETLRQAASILGVTARLADVAEGVIDPQALPGYGMVHPASGLQTIRAGLVDNFMDEDGGPLLAWYRYSARHPRWRFAITSAAVAFFIAMVVLKIASQNVGTLWIPILGLALWSIDIAIPRPKTRRREKAQPAQPSSAVGPDLAD